jgi:hypothetical protein
MFEGNETMCNDGDEKLSSNLISRKFIFVFSFSIATKSLAFCFLFLFFHIDFVADEIFIDNNVL